MKGKCKWFSDQKGYGFITKEDGRDVFVHFKDIVGDGHRKLVEGQEVSFEVVSTSKGAKAVNVVG